MYRSISYRAILLKALTGYKVNGLEITLYPTDLLMCFKVWADYNDVFS